MQDTGCRIQDAGCKIQDAGCRMQDTGATLLFLFSSCSGSGFRI